MRIGSLCSGYGGLEMAVQSVLGGTTAWVSDIDKGACKILAHRFPDVPNLGDFTTTDWATVEPVDLICAGFPCQPVSHAGKRLGDQDERWLWDDVLRAVREVRPGLVVLENVRGLLTARDGELFGRVLGSLADLGYDASWHGIKAADVGAPHGRFRVFIVAADADREGRGSDGRLDTQRRDADRRGGADRPGAATEPAPRLLKTPTSQLAVNGGSQHPDKRKAGGHGPTLADEVEHLLPTPAVNDMGAGKTVEEGDAWTDRMKAEHGNGNGHGKSLSIEAARLLPTPTDVTKGGGKSRSGARSGEALLNGIDRLLRTPQACEGRKAVASERSAARLAGGHQPFLTNQVADYVAEGMEWGQYAVAITRWEHTLGRPAPAPTETGPKGSPRLSAAFVEWMMGLPAGWVTDVPGVTRNEALKALGNGVVPQQGAEALREMFSWAVAA